MAAKKKTSNQATNSFKEFELKGNSFDYSGRIYVDRKREAGKLTIYPITLCLNGVFTVKGCSFYETANNMWIGGPQYKQGEDYKDYLYIDKEINDDMDALAEAIEKVID